MATRLSTRIKPLARPLISYGKARFTLRTNYITRGMATTSAEKIDWLCILPDFEGVLSKRMEVRPDHFSNLQPEIDSGFWKLGGAMLEEKPQEGQTLKIIGSCMIANAASKEEVIVQLKADTYFKNQVWDWEKVQIYPFKTAFRNP